MDKVEKQEKDIELRSEEVQEVLGRVPSWILRRGIFLLVVFVFVLIIGSWFYKSPEIIKSTLVLTSDTPPVGIVAKISGKISELYVKDQQFVNKGECLAVLENIASYSDIIYLGNGVSKLRNNVELEKVFYFDRENLKLGTIQSVYSNLKLQLDKYNQFILLNYYPRKIQSVKQLISANKIHIQNVLKQKDIVYKQYELEKRSFDREDYLRNQKMVSEEESDKSKGQLLQSEMSIQNMQSTLESMNISILQMEESLVDVEQQYLENKSSLLSEINASINQLQTEILSWKSSYLLTSPCNGKISFSNYWSIDQNVTAGDVVFTVVPSASSTLLGKALLPAERSGKVRVGQKVNIHFVNYPDNEYGMVVGVVDKISLIPIGGKYTVVVTFPNGLLTTYGKRLPLTHEMTANADIITNDLRLIDQFFLPIKKIFRNNL